VKRRAETLAGASSYNLILYCSFLTVCNIHVTGVLVFLIRTLSAAQRTDKSIKFSAIRSPALLRKAAIFSALTKASKIDCQCKKNRLTWRLFEGFFRANSAWFIAQHPVKW